MGNKKKKSYRETLTDPKIIKGSHYSREREGRGSRGGEERSLKNNSKNKHIKHRSEGYVGFFFHYRKRKHII